MGLLDSIFGGGDSGRGGGGPSKLALGLMALLAYRAYQKNGGSLSDMLGGGGREQPGQDGGYPGNRMPGGHSARTGGGSGGLESILGGLLGGGAGRAGGAGGLGGLLTGGLGGVLGGAAAGTLLNGGLGDLVRRFQQNGQSHVADSWIGHSSNQSLAPEELENAVGRDTLETLSAETGRPYHEVLSELSRSLPDTVDKLTPEGRLPTDEEASRWM